MKKCIKNAIKKNINLHNADLRNADLRNAYLHKADLHNADLRYADLRNADLDFACFPLSCKGTEIKIDDRFIGQLIYHLTRQNYDNCSGGVKEAIKHIQKMGISNLFCEYRDDLKEF